MLRYAIALGLAGYAMSKIYPVQFGPISTTGLERRVGELSPSTLLWVFMEYSRVYCTVAGVMEMLAVVLLCFRRTATLGALVCVGVMANVMLVNLCFHFNVKLYSTAMVASAAVLVLYDARYLARLLVLRRAIPSRPIHPPFRSRRLNQARWLLKLIFVGGVLWSSSIDMREILARRAADVASPLSGGWEVTSLIMNGRELARTSEPSRWRRVMVTRGWFTIRFENESMVYCRSAAEDLARIVIVRCGDTQQEGVLHWTRSGNELRIEGAFDHAAVRASLTRRDDAELPLLKSRFRWTTDG